MIKIQTIEHCVEGVVVSQKVIKLFGLPIFKRYLETSNYTLAGQFDSNNYITKEEPSTENKMYKETKIGFTNETTTKETQAKDT